MTALLPADDATSPPPVGFRAFARKAARKPYAALQMCHKEPAASGAGETAGDDVSVHCSGSPPLPAAAVEQARSK